MLQAPGHVATFCRQQLNAPIPSPALFRPLLERFVHDVEAFAQQHAVPMIHFSRGQKKDALMSSSAPTSVLTKAWSSSASVKRRPPASKPTRASDVVASCLG